MSRASSWWTRSAWGARIAAVLAVILVLLLLIALASFAWAKWQQGQTVKQVEKNAATVAEGQKQHDVAVQAKEVETVRHEVVVVTKAQAAATKVESLPADGRYLPTVDALCLSRLYRCDPVCTSRVQHTGDCEKELPGGLSFRRTLALDGRGLPFFKPGLWRYATGDVS